MQLNRRFALIPWGWVVVAVSLPSFAWSEASTTIADIGFSTNRMDLHVRPGEDFYRFANGTWARNNPVPGDKARWNSFEELAEQNWAKLRQLLEEAGTAEADTGHPRQLVRDFFASAMDTKQIERAGLTPIQEALQEIKGVRSADDAARVLARHHALGSSALFVTSAWADQRNSETNAFYFGQGGLGMPTRDYYLEEPFATQREAYVRHVAAMFVLLGEHSSNAYWFARTILDIETELAGASMSQVELRDPVQQYNRMSVDEAHALAPRLPWRTYLAAVGLEDLDEIIVRQPVFFRTLSELVDRRPLSDWKIYWRWHLVRSAAPFLPAAFEQESFHFNSTVLADIKEMEPRWQRAARQIDRAIGEALGEMYVEKHYPPEAQRRMEEMVDLIKATFRSRLEGLDWMTEPTRERALTKFDRFTTKIGFPDKWRDYSPLVIDRDSYAGNVLRARAFEFNRQIAKVGQPVDKLEWGMTPPTVNAYFNPTANEIVFPAGILQPPFFDFQADDAVNYGSIGAVIAHEITHGYDDKGRLFDADGNLEDWWTETDAEQFHARSRRLVEQFNQYEAIDGLRVNGELSLGENIADLGGVSIAFEALQRSMDGQPRPEKIDGFTPEQRFFLAWAQAWRTNWQPEALRRQLVVGPHAPGQFRAVGPLVNLDVFYETFEINPEDPLYLAPDVRSVIW
jgi:putative endopeptidase